MADIVTKIGYAMSLRKPQQEALSYTDLQKEPQRRRSLQEPETV